MAADTDDGELRRQQALEREVVERRHQRAAGQVPRGAESDHRAGAGRAVAAQTLAQQIGRFHAHALAPSGGSPRTVAPTPEPANHGAPSGHLILFYSAPRHSWPSTSLVGARGAQGSTKTCRP